MTDISLHRDQMSAHTSIVIRMSTHDLVHLDAGDVEAILNTVRQTLYEMVQVPAVQEARALYRRGRRPYDVDATAVDEPVTTADDPAAITAPPQEEPHGP